MYLPAGLGALIGAKGDRLMHLTPEAALDVIEDRITGSERKSLIDHLETCSSCRQQFEDWGRLHLLLQGFHLKGAPVEFLQRAEAVFDALPETQPTIGEIIASVIFDSHADPAFAGARGGTDARQVLLRAQEFDIHLKISSNPAQQQIMGQIFARNESRFLSGVRLHLLLNGKTHKTTSSDNFGQFQFDDVPDSMCQLQIDLPELTIVGGITIGEKKD
jgi:hypothetical protein